jgi:hypothetical protein
VVAVFIATVLGLTASPAFADQEPNNGITQVEGPVSGGALYAGTLPTDNDEDWYSRPW